MRHPALQPAQRDPDAQLLERLRSGDEQAFMMLVRRYGPSMIRLAAGYVPSQAIAEEVVQEAWLGFLNGISRFEGRSSVRTWLFRILINRARTTGIRERRTMALADLTAAVDAAPPAAVVVTLRDVEGLSSEEVRGAREITEANQRVLLHRGRSRLRQMLESEFGRA
jgi:RNA polymerase sigma-70 factor, ECF subfamily